LPIFESDALAFRQDGNGDRRVGEVLNDDTWGSLEKKPAENFKQESAQENAHQQG